MNEELELHNHMIDPALGLLKGAQYSPSPNCDERPVNQSIYLLVIHGISLPPGRFDTNDVQAFFMNQLDVSQDDFFKEIAHLKVSSHLFIRRSGALWQFVPFHYRAWHAGQSSFQNVDNCNNYSIGIELEGTDNLPYTESQYIVLANTTRILMQYYPEITLDRIVGHSDIAPLRKTDPGPAFDWNYYKRLCSTSL